MWELDHKQGLMMKTYAFELWCWRKLLRLSQTEGRMNQSILKEINVHWMFTGRTNAEAPILWHLTWRTNSLEKTLTMGKIEGGRRRGRQRMRWLDGITDIMDIVWASSGRQWRRGKPGVLQSMGSQRVSHNWATEQQPTPVVLPGEFHGQRNLAGYSPLSRKELDMTEQLTVSLYFTNVFLIK